MMDILLSQAHKSMNGVVTDNGELAWTAQQTYEIMKLVEDKQWVVLGGDVLTRQFEYTCENWFFQPNHYTTLAQNVDESIFRCCQYISNFVKKNGDGFLFLLTISDAFIHGGSQIPPRK